MRVTKLIQEHAERVEQASKNLSKLAKKAERLGKVQEKRDNLEEHIKQAEMQVSACKGTIEALFGEYQRFTFAEDEEGIRTVREQRRILQEEVADLEHQIADAEQELAKVQLDGSDSAEVRALLDSFKAPSYADLLENIESELHEANAELSRYVQSTREQLPPPYLDDAETYQSVRESNDERYRSERATERYHARKEQERRAKLGRYGSADSTDQLHALMGSSHSLSGDTVSVTSDGSREHRFGVLDDD